MVDENQFFREATLKICGNLEIEKALFSTLQFLNQVMPVSRMALEYYDKSVKAMRTIAKANLKGGKSVDLITPLSAEAKQQAKEKYDLKKRGACLFENPKTERLAQEMLIFHGVEASSLMVLSLKSGDQMIGTLALIAEGDDIFTQKHLDLISLLSEPFAIALSNTLTHRSELKLQDRDFFWEVTTRICGNLDIEKGMNDCINFLSQYMPADALYLFRYEQELGSMRYVARADADKGEKLEALVEFPPEIKPLMTERLKARMAGKLPPVLVINDVEEDPIAKFLFDALGEPFASNLNLPLMIEGQLEGGLSLLAKGKNRFNEHHAKLYENLRVPFAIAMSNTLKHRSLLKLHDRDFFWEATTRICGNLEIEESLWSCLNFLSQHMPADSIYLERYDENFSAMRYIARANKEKGEPMDIAVPLSEEARAKVVEDMRKVIDNPSPFFIINKPDEHPIARELLKALDHPPSSILGIPLVVSGQFAGAVILVAEGNNRFNDRHAQLYATLKVPFFVAMTNAVKHREILKLKDLLADDNRFLHDELHRLSGDEIIGANFGLREVMYKVQQVASIDSPVLLLGETGVGKDVIANTIHYSSARSDGPFVAVNCGAIPDELIDSELFGHEKGAFTGALSQKRGRFERADKGTIFLDEIGELPLAAQVRLLRVLQSKEIERVGGAKTISLDIRIIAATNRNLEEMVKAKLFREDLWFRLNVFPIIIPPLRDRLSDLPALVRYFVERKSKELKIGTVPMLADGAIDTLMAYDWPGNVRELENVIERAMILTRSGSLQFEDLGSSPDKKTDIRQGPSQDEIVDLDTLVKRHIEQALELAGGKIHGPGGAGERLGVNPDTLRYRMKKLGIPFRKKSHRSLALKKAQPDSDRAYNDSQ
ncbi:MAG: sigma 54-interacting transcriptional regulator [Thermodesulfobacteriota bacterium]|nr:sigma 54-interacting transcriptional regulator [Thermodesulfobacteriota bacterium]